MKSTLLSLTTALIALLFFQGCYSFRGTSIAPGVETYYVEQFRNNADNSPPALEVTLAEDLKEKIRSESRLILSEIDPDLEFKGTLVSFRVTSEAPAPGEVTAINRLTIITAIEYIDHTDEENNWKQNFSFFFDFPSTTDLVTVQDEAIEAISRQMMEDIFNKAFTNW